MSDATSLRSGDVDGLLAFVGEATATEADHPFALPVLEALSRLVRADRVGYFDYHGDPAGCAYAHATRLLELDWSAGLVRDVLPSYPLRESANGLRTSAVRLSDLLTRNRKLRNPWYMTIMRPCRVEHELKVWLPAAPGGACGFYLTRDAGSRDFDERDRAVLTILRPHLAVLRSRRRRPVGMSDRELEILSLVRLGLTNEEIADRLVLSRHTVRTHLERIFEKLGVHTRTAAVRHAFDSAA